MKNIIIYAFIILSSCTQNPSKNDIGRNKEKQDSINNKIIFEKNKEAQNSTNDKIVFEKLYMGDSKASQVNLAGIIDKKCAYYEAYVKQPKKWYQECPVCEMGGNYYNKLKGLKQTEGKFGKFTLLVKRYEHTEKYFDDFAGSEQEISTDKLVLYTLKDKRKVDSLDIYIEKYSIWGTLDKLYYISGNTIWLLTLDTDVETGISIDEWKRYKIDSETGKIKLIETIYTRHFADDDNSKVK